MSWKEYEIWYRYMPETGWPTKCKKANDLIKARTMKEAKHKMIKKYARAGFSAMQMWVKEAPCINTTT